MAVIRSMLSPLLSLDSLFPGRGESNMLGCQRSRREPRVVHGTSEIWYRSVFPLELTVTEICYAFWSVSLYRGLTAVLAYHASRGAQEV